MFNLFIYPTNETKEGSNHAYLIECDARALLELYKHVAHFVLRSKIKLVGVAESFDVYSVLDDHPAASGNEEETTPPSNEALMEHLGKMNAAVGKYYNRVVNHMGYRVIVSK